MTDVRSTEPSVGRKRYYHARGFSTYYFANAIFNIVIHSSSYIRGIEDILGDLKTAWFTAPFKAYTNLHDFSRQIINDILFEGLQDPDKDLALLRDFIKKYEIPIVIDEYSDDTDALDEALASSEEFDRSLEELTDEVFHVLFDDLGFLQDFNELIACYIEQAKVDAGSNPNVKKGGTLRRVTIPEWVRKAIYFRDRGECRTCKRTLAMTFNQTEFERYDHIVPLASHGANDVTNLQLLCEACNLKKSSLSEPVSLLYLKALQR